MSGKGVPHHETREQRQESLRVMDEDITELRLQLHIVNLTDEKEALSDLRKAYYASLGELYFEGLKALQRREDFAIDPTRHGYFFSQLCEQLLSVFDGLYFDMGIGNAGQRYFPCWPTSQEFEAFFTSTALKHPYFTEEQEQQLEEQKQQLEVCQPFRNANFHFLSYFANYHKHTCPIKVEVSLQGGQYVLHFRFRPQAYLKPIWFTYLEGVDEARALDLYDRIVSEGNLRSVPIGSSGLRCFRFTPHNQGVIRQFMLDNHIGFRADMPAEYLFYSGSTMRPDGADLRCPRSLFEFFASLFDAAETLMPRLEGGARPIEEVTLLPEGQRLVPQNNPIVPLLDDGGGGSYRIESIILGNVYQKYVDHSSGFVTKMSLLRSDVHTMISSLCSMFETTFMHFFYHYLYVTDAGDEVTPKMASFPRLIKGLSSTKTKMRTIFDGAFGRIFRGRNLGAAYGNVDARGLFINKDPIKWMGKLMKIFNELKHQGGEVVIDMRTVEAIVQWLGDRGIPWILRQQIVTDFTTVTELPFIDVEDLTVQNAGMMLPTVWTNPGGEPLQLQHPPERSYYDLPSFAAQSMNAGREVLERFSRDMG